MRVEGSHRFEVCYGAALVFSNPLRRAVEPRTLVSERAAWQVLAQSRPAAHCSGRRRPFESARRPSQTEPRASEHGRTFVRNRGSRACQKCRGQGRGDEENSEDPKISTAVAAHLY